MAKKLTKEDIDKILDAVGVLQSFDVDTTSVTGWLSHHLPEVDEVTGEPIYASPSTNA